MHDRYGPNPLAFLLQLPVHWTASDYIKFQTLETTRRQILERKANLNATINRNGRSASAMIEMEACLYQTNNWVMDVSQVLQDVMANFNPTDIALAMLSVKPRRSMQ